MKENEITNKETGTRRQSKMLTLQNRPLSFDVSSSNISPRVNLYFSLGYFF